MYHLIIYFKYAFYKLEIKEKINLEFLDLKYHLPCDLP